MPILANALGILAVACFVGSYQLKSRRNLIVLNAISRVLYVAQYILLGAFEGAVLDIVALLVSLLCKYRHHPFIQKHLRLMVLLSNAVIVLAGLLVYQNVFSLLPIFGVIFETLALWPVKESKIRTLSLLGAPFWLAYNLLSSAYGSAVGNVITLVSITVAILRYDVLKKNVKNEREIT